MLSGLGLGTYRAGTSVAHQMDARSKIVAAFGVTVAAFGAVHNYYFAVIVAMLILASAVARLDLVALARSMALILIGLLISSVIIAFLLPGKPYIHFGPINISRDGYQFALRSFFQFATLIYAAQVLTLTTAPLAIATGLQRLCRPLKLVRVPIDELAMLITLALTFLPLIREQVRTVIDAQLARGVDLRRGPMETRLRGVLSFFNPIISANLRRAGDLATAMEARGYRVGASRSHLREQRFRMPDYVLLVITVVVALAAILV